MAARLPQAGVAASFVNALVIDSTNPARAWRACWSPYMELYICSCSNYTFVCQ